VARFRLEANGRASLTEISCQVHGSYRYATNAETNAKVTRDKSTRMSEASETIRTVP
jgi:hypothetical protein